MFDFISELASIGNVDPVILLNSSMSHSPRSQLSSPPSEIKKLTSYFALSSSPRKRCLALHVDTENDQYGVASKKPRVAHDGTSAATAVDISNLNMDVAVALQRIESYHKPAAMRSVRAGDEGVFLVRRGATIGRSVNPDAHGSSVAINYRHKKMNLGIYGSESGVSRKQLVVQRVSPLIKMKQFSSVTNQVYVVRYNPLTRLMETQGTYIRKDAEFELKKGDVLVMDNGRVKPNYIFRVVDCYVPPTSNHPKKPLCGQMKLDSPSRCQTIDLVSAPSNFSTSSVCAKPAKPDNQISLNATETAATQFTILSSGTCQGSKPDGDEPMTEQLLASQDVKSEIPVPKVTLPDASIRKDDPFQVNERSASSFASTKQIDTDNQISSTKTKANAISQSLSSSPGKCQESKPDRDEPMSEPLMATTDVKSEILAATVLDAKIRNEYPVDVCRNSTLRKGNAQTSREEKPAAASDVMKSAHADPVSLMAPRESRSKQATVARLPLLIEPPKVGDLLRVLYESQDTFLRLRSSWWLATVRGVEKSKLKSADSEPVYQLSLSFRDQTIVDHVFPSADLQKLKIDDACRFVHVLKAVECESESEVAFDLNPEAVEAGDLVDALYQDGRESGRWYRGRVAAFDTTTKTCTICYEDGDAETGVPLGEGKIILVERGCSDMSWLVDLDIYDDFLPRLQHKAPIPKDVVGSVKKIETDNRQSMIIISLSKKKTVMRVPYTDFVSYLFASLLSRYKCLKTWPAPGGASVPSRTVRKAFRALTEGRPDVVNAIEPTEVKPRGLRKKVCTKADVGQFREEDWDITTTSTSPLTFKDAADMQEMPSTVSNSFFRSLHSTDPGVGADLLMQIAACHQRGMNASLGRQIRDLLCEGPTSEGTHFPDQHRVEVTLKYLDKLVACAGGELNLSRSCSPNEWPELQEMMESIVSPQYVFDCDGFSEASEGWLRMIDSLHLIKSGAVFLSMLFKAELREEMEKKTPDKSKCRGGPLATAIWSNACGARNSVKAVVKIFVCSWIKYGHYMFCDFAPLKGTPGAPSAMAISRCRDEAKRILRELGSVVSYVLWLYLVCEGVRVNTRELACIVNEVYECEVLRSDVVPLVFNKTKTIPAPYLKKRKLYMILSIDNRILSGLLLDLAKKLGVDKEYNILVE